MTKIQMKVGEFYETEDGRGHCFRRGGDRFLVAVGLSVWSVNPDGTDPNGKPFVLRHLPLAEDVDDGGWVVWGALGETVPCCLSDGRDYRRINGVWSYRRRKPRRVPLSSLTGTVEVRGGKPLWDSYEEGE